jgi:hypothetical protein
MDKKIIWMDDDTHYELKVMAILKKVTMGKMIQILINEQAVKDDKQ